MNTASLRLELELDLERIDPLSNDQVPDVRFLFVTLDPDAVTEAHQTFDGRIRLDLEPEFLPCVAAEVRDIELRRNQVSELDGRARDLGEGDRHLRGGTWIRVAHEQDLVLELEKRLRFRPQLAG
jgi:hypothetical protein